MYGSHAAERFTGGEWMAAGRAQSGDN